MLDETTMEGRNPMSKKKRSSDEEIWSKRFDEEYEDLEYVSRSERTKNEKQNNDEGMSPMLTGTVMFLAVLILATIFYYVWYSNRPMNQPEIADEPGIESVEKEEATEEPESEPEPEPEIASEPEVEPEPTPPVGEGATYTVQAGDNMYRIALNHGMTTAELMALNNLTSESVFVGQELRVE